MNRAPLPLPDDFDPQACLLAKVTENGTFHESRRGAHLAASLVANGTAEDLALAVRVLEATLRRPSYKAPNDTRRSAPSGTTTSVCMFRCVSIESMR